MFEDVESITKRGKAWVHHSNLCIDENIVFIEN